MHSMTNIFALLCDNIKQIPDFIIYFILYLLYVYATCLTNSTVIIDIAAAELIMLHSLGSKTMEGDILFLPNNPHHFGRISQSWPTLLTRRAARPRINHL